MILFVYLNLVIPDVILPGKSSGLRHGCKGIWHV